MQINLQAASSLNINFMLISEFTSFVLGPTDGLVILRQFHYTHTHSCFVKGLLYSQPYYTVFEIAYSVKKVTYYRFDLARLVHLVCVSQILPVSHYSFFTLEHFHLISLRQLYNLQICIIHCMTLTIKILTLSFTFIWYVIPLHFLFIYWLSSNLPSAVYQHRDHTQTDDTVESGEDKSTTSIPN